VAASRAHRARIDIVKIVHAVVGAMLFVVPALSRVFGSGALAWTMYARTGEFRLEIVGQERDGRYVYVAPTALASKVAPSIDSMFAGSDHFRPYPAITLLRKHLVEVARLACDEGPFVRVHVTLEQRDDESSPVHATSAESPCP
jgi:hypothetical protein